MVAGAATARACDEARAVPLLPVLTGVTPDGQHQRLSLKRE